MSEPVSALAGATYEGYCTVRDLGPSGMVTIRGNLAARGFGAAIKRATGCGMPGQGAVVSAKARRLAWMSPDELMLFCDYGAAAGLAADLGDALAKFHALAVDVSDARVHLRIEGAGVREVLAKLTPADMSPAAFGPGVMRRTRLAQVPAALFMPEAGVAEVIAFRSVGRYVFDLIANAAKPGSEVGLFATPD